MAAAVLAVPGPVRRALSAQGARDKQSLVPLTIKQVLSAKRGIDNDEAFCVEGCVPRPSRNSARRVPPRRREVHTIRVIGNIMNVTVKDTRTTYSAPSVALRGFSACF